MNSVKILCNNSNRIIINIHENPFLFGVPNKKNSTIRATAELNKFSELCGAEKPQYIRSTNLRKHFATKCQVKNLKENEIGRGCEFLRARHKHT